MYACSVLSAVNPALAASITAQPIAEAKMPTNKRSNIATGFFLVNIRPPISFILVNLGMRFGERRFTHS